MIEIFSHRIIFNGIENSVESIPYYKKLGIGIELDLRYNNNQVYISHDPTNKGKLFEEVCKQCDKSEIRMALHIKEKEVINPVIKILKEYSFLIRKVLSQANILDFLDRSCKGIFTKVGENGVKLSGGQKQRVAIARALYNDPEILVLDEATSALDSNTEDKIVNEIYNISQDKTLIIISHRLNTLNNVDKIYTVKNRKIKKEIEK